MVHFNLLNSGYAVRHGPAQEDTNQYILEDPVEASQDFALENHNRMSP